MQPNLIHPVWVTIQQLNTTASFYDPRAREPVRIPQRDGALSGYGSEVRIKGQVSFYFAGAKLDYSEYLKQGVLNRTVGYVSFRFKDLIRKGLATQAADGEITMVLKKQDKIVRLANRSVELWVTGFKDFGFYPDKGQTLIQVNFEDRRPSE